ncbi:MAG TPA: hypothetical protein VLJ86_19000 [Ramlibacter sp.]|nr:hypothetical protein [Ramlibacter sp.]
MARESLAHFIRAVPTRSDAECEAAAPGLADALFSVCDLRDAAGLLEEAFALAVSLPPAARGRAFGYVSRAVRATHLQEAVLPAALPATAGLPAVQKSAVIAALAGAVAAADLCVANRSTALTRWIAASLEQSCAADAARLGAFVGAWIREGWGDAGWLDVLRNFLAHGDPACPHRAQALSAMVVAFAPKDDEPDRLKILVRALTTPALRETPIGALLTWTAATLMTAQQTDGAAITRVRKALVAAAGKPLSGKACQHLRLGLAMASDPLRVRTMGLPEAVENEHLVLVSKAQTQVFLALDVLTSSFMITAGETKASLLAPGLAMPLADSGFMTAPADRRWVLTAASSSFTPRAEALWMPPLAIARPQQPDPGSSLSSAAARPSSPHQALVDAIAHQGTECERARLTRQEMRTCIRGLIDRWQRELADEDRPAALRSLHDQIVHTATPMTDSARQAAYAALAAHIHPPGARPTTQLRRVASYFAGTRGFHPALMHDVLAPVVREIFAERTPPRSPAASMRDVLDRMLANAQPGSPAIVARVIAGLLTREAAQAGLLPVMLERLARAPASFTVEHLGAALKALALRATMAPPRLIKAWLAALPAASTTRTAEYFAGLTASLKSDDAGATHVAMGVLGAELGKWAASARRDAPLLANAVCGAVGAPSGDLLPPAALQAFLNALFQNIEPGLASACAMLSALIHQLDGARPASAGFEALRIALHTAQLSLDGGATLVCLLDDHARQSCTAAEHRDLRTRLRLPLADSKASPPVEYVEPGLAMAHDRLCFLTQTDLNPKRKLLKLLAACSSQAVLSLAMLVSRVDDLVKALGAGLACEALQEVLDQRPERITLADFRALRDALLRVAPSHAALDRTLHDCYQTVLNSPAIEWSERGQFARQELGALRRSSLGARLKSVHAMLGPMAARRAAVEPSERKDAKAGGALSEAQARADLAATISPNGRVSIEALSQMMRRLIGPAYDPLLKPASLPWRALIDRLGPLAPSDPRLREILSHAIDPTRALHALQSEKFVRELLKAPDGERTPAEVRGLRALLLEVGMAALDRGAERQAIAAAPVMRFALALMRLAQELVGSAQSVRAARRDTFARIVEADAPWTPGTRAVAYVALFNESSGRCVDPVDILSQINDVVARSPTLPAVLLPALLRPVAKVIARSEDAEQALKLFLPRLRQPGTTLPVRLQAALFAGLITPATLQKGLLPMLLKALDALVADAPRRTRQAARQACLRAAVRMARRLEGEAAAQLIEAALQSSASPSSRSRQPFS